MTKIKLKLQLALSRIASAFQSNKPNQANTASPEYYQYDYEL